MHSTQLHSTSLCCTTLYMINSIPLHLITQYSNLTLILFSFTTANHFCLNLPLHLSLCHLFYWILTTSYFHFNSSSNIISQLPSSPLFSSLLSYPLLSSLLFSSLLSFLFYFFFLLRISSPFILCHHSVNQLKSN